VFLQGDAVDALYGVVTGKIRISASSPHGHEMFLTIMEAADTTLSPSCSILSVPVREASGEVKAQYLAIYKNGSIEFVPVTVGKKELTKAGAVEQKPDLHFDVVDAHNAAHIVATDPK
jgi:hypothetical protein